MIYFLKQVSLRFPFFNSELNLNSVYDQERNYGNSNYDINIRTITTSQYL